MSTVVHAIVRRDLTDWSASGLSTLFSDSRICQVRGSGDAELVETAEVSLNWCEPARTIFCLDGGTREHVWLESLAVTLSFVRVSMGTPADGWWVVLDPRTLTVNGVAGDDLPATLTLISPPVRESAGALVNVPEMGIFDTGNHVARVLDLDKPTSVAFAEALTGDPDSASMYRDHLGELLLRVLYRSSGQTVTAPGKPESPARWFGWQEQSTPNFTAITALGTEHEWSGHIASWE